MDKRNTNGELTNTSTELQVEEPCIIGGEIRTTGFLHSKEETEQNKKKEEVRNLKTTGKGHWVLYTFLYLYLKVKPNAGQRMVIRSRYKVKGYSLVYKGQTYFYLYIWGKTKKRGSKWLEE